MKPEELDAVYRRAINRAGPVPDTIPRQDAEFAYLYFAYLFRELADVKAGLAEEAEKLRYENHELRKENLDLHREIKRITERRKKK